MLRLLSCDDGWRIGDRMRFNGCCTMSLTDERKLGERPRCTGGSQSDGGARGFRSTYGEARGFRSSYGGGRVRKEESMSGATILSARRIADGRRKDGSGKQRVVVIKLHKEIARMQRETGRKRGKPFKASLRGSDRTARLQPNGCTCTASMDDVWSLTVQQRACWGAPPPSA